LWLCDRQECLAAGKGVYAMGEAEMDVFEMAALDDASAAAGGFLESMNAAEMPMADMPPDVWQAFMKTTIEAFQDSLRKQLLDHVVPF
jgi:hypothetical protein